MAETPRAVLESAVRSLCGRTVDRAVRLTSGGLHETYRVELAGDAPVVLRIARQGVPWFTDEAHLTGLARAVGVPAPEVLGTEHLELDGALLSFSVQRLVPGHPLEALRDVLPARELERLMLEAGELLARVHSVVPDRGMRHDLSPPDDALVARASRTAHSAAGAATVAVVERGADLLRSAVRTHPAPRLALAQGDFLPKHLLIDDGAIVGVIDWEFAGPASPAFDLARWEVSAGEPLHDRGALLRRGYARVADPDEAAAGWVPAFAIDWALELLGWRNPASPAQIRRCVDVIARYTGP